MLYSFEDFVLDTGRRELRRGGGLLAIEPKVFDFLVHLIANREQVVGKDDLIAAIWGGRVISESALTSCINAARTALGDSGEAQRLIKTLPRKGWRFIGEVKEGAMPAAAGAPAERPAPKAALALPDLPSIAVLPFTNIGADPEQEYFADGVVEEIITALSRLRGLFVIARNSSFTYKGRSIDAKQVGRDLGVRYVLQGSVRRAADRIRIATQLIDAASGVNLSADRFEGTLEDIFDLQDRVTESVVGAIAPKLEQAEIARVRHKPTESLDAYDLYLRGMASYHLLSREGTADALRLLYKAIERDPDFAMAYAMAAMCYARRKGNSWIEDRPHEFAETRRLARQAVRLGKDDAGALSVAGFALAYAGEELTDGAAVIERGLSLNPNFAAALHWSGWAKVWLGEPEAAIVHLTHAMRLSPVDPFLQMMKVAIAHAQFFAGRFEEAAAWSNAALLEHPDSHAGLRMAAASHAMAGRSAEAGKAMARLRQIDPALRVSNLRETLAPYRDQAPVTLYEDALRKAGLPE